MAKRQVQKSGRINSDRLRLSRIVKKNNIKSNEAETFIHLLKFRSKMGQIEKDSQRFPVSCCVVKPPFCIPGTSISWTRLVHLFTILIVSVIAHFCYAAWFCRNLLYFRLAPNLENKGFQSKIVHVLYEGT